MLNILTSRPSKHTLRVLTWTSFETVAKSLVQKIQKSLKPSGRRNFSSFPELFSLMRFAASESIEGKTGIKESVTIGCFGGRLSGAPTKTLIFCNSGCDPLFE
jgi:hypothetical protein